VSADERPAEQGGAFAVLLAGVGRVPGYRFTFFPPEGDGDFSSHVSTEGEARAMAARLTAAMAASLSQGTATVCRVMTEAAFEARLATERARVRAEAEGELTRVTCERNAFETRLSAFRMVAEHARQVRDGGYGRAHAECAVDAMAKCLDDDEALAASVEGSDLRPAPGESSEDFVRRITKGRTMVAVRDEIAPGDPIATARTFTVDAWPGEEPRPAAPPPPSLSALQAALPWGNRYTRAFFDNPQAHKHFAHALVHIVKAAGALASLVDELEHEATPTLPSVQGLRELHKRYLADVVISALRAANTFPGGALDLDAEVAARMAGNAATKGVGP